MGPLFLISRPERQGSWPSVGPCTTALEILFTALISPRIGRSFARHFLRSITPDKTLFTPTLTETLDTKRQAKFRFEPPATAAFLLTAATMLTNGPATFHMRNCPRF